MSELTFQESDHSYALDGRPIPSVTQILADVGIINPLWFSESAAARGTYLHRCIEAHEQDDLDLDLVPAEYRGYLESFKRGRDLLKIDKVVGVELRVANKPEGWAGTVDLAGIAGGDGLIVDWKSGTRAKWHRLQTSAYSLCDFSEFGEAFDFVRRASLYLDKDGGVPDFSFHENTSDDARNWRACLRVFQLKREK